MHGASGSADQASKQPREPAGHEYINQANTHTKLQQSVQQTGKQKNGSTKQKQRKKKNKQKNNKKKTNKHVQIQARKASQQTNSGQKTNRWPITERSKEAINYTHKQLPNQSVKQTKKQTSKEGTEYAGKQPIS